MTKSKYLFATLGVLLCSALLLLLFKDNQKPDQQENSLSSNQSTQNGKSIRPDNSAPALHINDKGVLNERLASAGQISEEMFIAQLMEDLRSNENAVINLLADESWFEKQGFDPENVGDALLKFYLDNDRIFAGLRAFETLHSNTKLCDLNLDKFAIKAHEEDSVKAFDWTLKHADYEGAPSALYELGNRSNNREEMKQNISAVIESDYDDYTKSAYLAGSFDEWIESDFEGALEHLSEIPSTPALDTIIYGAMDYILEADPEVARLWSEEIHNEEMKAAALRDIESFEKEFNSPE